MRTSIASAKYVHNTKSIDLKISEKSVWKKNAKKVSSFAGSNKMEGKGRREKLRSAFLRKNHAMRRLNFQSYSNNAMQIFARMFCVREKEVRSLEKQPRLLLLAVLLNIGAWSRRGPYSSFSQTFHCEVDRRTDTGSEPLNARLLAVHTYQERGRPNVNFRYCLENNLCLCTT